MHSRNPYLDRVLARILDALDEMMSHALDTTTRPQIIAEERRLNQIVIRAQLILSYLHEKRVRPAPKVHRHGEKKD